MAIKNSVSNNFLSTFVDSINVFNCHLSSVLFPSRKCHICFFHLLHIYLNALQANSITEANTINPDHTAPKFNV